MSSSDVIDPLETVDRLAEEISGANNTAGEIPGLIRAIDALAYSIHFIGPDVPYIEQTGSEPPRLDYRKVYAAIKRRYPTLGFYWLALHPVMQDGIKGEIVVGDAIDDLADILLELSEVQWFAKQTDRINALAAMRFRYESHLWMHVHSLRQYLEEMRHDD